MGSAVGPPAVAAAHDGAHEVGHREQGVGPRVDMVPAPRLQGHGHGPGQGRSVLSYLLNIIFF